ncbi:hypothetical protein RclHR1_17610003 [Rhizophagus clarus]|uniref:Uncharacterized protein n=1 Tax=Rhizophagus clarus TaxID=94130 RepID=A0A2Z6QZ67_9GLOM|nr:hypothetical protein RclHR1_17610003 [Rhizophagus clarus]
MRNDYVASILHTTLHIVRDETEKEFNMCHQHEIIGEKSFRRVNYAIKDEAFNSEYFDYLYDIVSTARDWHFLLYSSGEISQASEALFTIKFNKKALEKDSEEYQALHNGVKKIMSSEFELSKQHIIKLEAKNVNLRRKISEFDAERAELKRRIAETLRMTEEERMRRIAKNAKLRATIEKLKSENIEVRDKLTKVEQNQSLNDNSSNNSPPSFIAVPEVITKIVSSEIKQHNKEKKLLRELAKNQVLAVTSVDSKLTCDKKTVTNGNDQDLKLSLNTGDNISSPSSIEDNLSCNMKMITCTDNEDIPSDEMSGLIATQPLDRNQVTEQTLKHELSRPISLVALVKLYDESILNNTIEGFMQRLAYWINEVIRMGLKEILCLYHYSLEFKEKVKNITADSKIKDKTARSMIYKDMLHNDQSHVFSKTVTNGNDLTSITPQASVPFASSRMPIPRTNPNKMECLYQYAVEYGLDPKKFLIVTEADKKRWVGESFRSILEVNMQFYCEAIEEKEEDPRKYRKFLTDRKRMISEELLRHNILKHRSSTAWLDDLMKE